MVVRDTCGASPQKQRLQRRENTILFGREQVLQFGIVHLFMKEITWQVAPQVVKHLAILRLPWSSVQTGAIGVAIVLFRHSGVQLVPPAPIMLIILWYV